MSAKRPSRSRAALRRSARWTSYVLSGLIATVVVLLVGLATTPGRGVVANLIQRAVQANGISVGITNFSGWPPFNFAAEKVVLHDVDGMFAEIDRLEGRLRFTDLFSAVVSLESLGAERVALLRLPKLEPTTTDGEMISLSVDKFAVPRLELGETLAAKPVVLSLAGSWQNRAGGQLRASVNATRADGKTGTASATIVRVDRNSPLVLDAKVEEGPDGVLLALLGQESGPAYRVAAKTEAKAAGPSGQALAGTLQLASSGTAQFDGRFDMTLADAKRTLVAKGDGNFGELLPPELAGVLAGPVQIAIDADWIVPDASASKSKAAPQASGLPQIVIREGKVRSATLAAEASGRLDDAASDLTLKLDVRSASGGSLRIPRVAGAQLRSLNLTGHAAPVEGRMRLRLDGSVDGFVLDKTSIPRAQLSASVTSAGRDPLVGGRLPFTLRVEADRVDTPAGRVAAATGAPIVLNADGALDTAKNEAATRASVALGGTRIGFDGVLAARGATGKATANVPDLRVLAPFIGRTLSGALDANAEGTFASATGTRLNVAATGTDINPGDATLAKLLAGKSSARLNLALNRTGALSITNLALDANALKASGSATLSATTVEANIEGRLADLAALARDSQGAVRFAVKATGARDAPTLDATLRLDQGRLLGKPVEQVNARVEGRPGAKGWSGKLAIDGRYNGQRIEGGADAVIDTSTNVLDVPRIDIAVGADRIRGALRRNAKGGIDGTLDVAAPDLGSLAALALIDVSGSANAKLTLSSTGAQQKLAGTFTGSNIKVPDASSRRKPGPTVTPAPPSTPSPADLVTLGTASGTFEIDDLFGTPRVRGNVDATKIAAGGLALDTASAQATVASSGATRFTASAKNADLDLSGGGTFAEKGATATQLTIDTLAGNAYRVPLRLAAPAVIDFDGERVAVRGVNVAAGGGSLRVDGPVAPALDVMVVADRINASLANIFAKDLGAEGTLSGRASVTGKPDAPAAAWQVDWTGMRLTATKNAGLPALALNARGNATKSDTTLEARISGAGASFTVNGKLPYSGTGLSLAINGNAPLALLALETTRELRLGGSARVNVTVTGALKSPQIAGAADLVDATLADMETGFGVTGATGRIAFTGQRATIEKVTGRLLQGGQVSLGGTIDIAGKNLPASLEARVENGRYADGKIVNTTFNGRLAIEGPLLGSGTVTGTMVLGRTEIQLPDRFGGAASAMQVTHLHAKPGFKDPLARRERTDAGGGAGGGALKLAVELTNTGGIFVRGFGIDAEFGGALRLAGTIASPEAIGAFTMRRGRLEVLGKRFDLTNGRLTFAGDFVPQLDFRGTTTAGDVAVTLLVNGPASDPAITMTSSPELPQEEIMSRLLFERSVGSLSPLQAVQLIDAVSRFTGVNRGSSIFDRIRRATGLDDLDVRQNAAGQTTVGVGRRLSDRVRLGVEAGTGDSSGRVAIDLEITKNLKARGEAGQDSSGKIGLTYEREY